MHHDFPLYFLVQRRDIETWPRRAGRQDVSEGVTEPGDAQLPHPGVRGPPAPVPTLQSAPGSPHGIQTGQKQMASSWPMAIELEQAHSWFNSYFSTLYSYSFLKQDWDQEWACLCFVAQESEFKLYQSCCGFFFWSYEVSVDEINSNDNSVYL